MQSAFGKDKDIDKSPAEPSLMELRAEKVMEGKACTPAMFIYVA